ncbi:lactate utilization protein C [Amycolatopsis sp. DG1A-15b]|uniref:LutC/YkgG family protein n=1 Tax=Amycolatopsis sp. DG1A-15b TaxID=3052846 RepID=UPI00255C0475|nr:lactate utilization protein C [Amycolatopsis sp. DG1A-15b]WIX90257.1 lactate utilization protein C [Amycolatopsis sp. DG1A-15b]
MTAREEILAAVRGALREADRTEAVVPRGYRSDVADVAALFAERVVDYRAALTRCTAAELPDALRAALGPSRNVLVPDGFPVAVDGSPPPATTAGLAGFDAVVTTAALGIATTGTIVLDHGPGQGRRALSLVPDVHVCVLRAEQIVPGVPEAVAALDPARPQTWISGPSATSDIELTRVEGVHGPRTLHVIVVTE